jgi:hypothetical protein
MKLNYTPQVGLRRRKPDQRRERLAFWGGIAIVAAFELILMAKGWSPPEASQGAESDVSAPPDAQNSIAGQASPLPSRAD